MMRNREIGGFFELELREGFHYHKDALALNSARNCLKYVIAARQIRKIYIPAYCCDSLLEPIVCNKINYDYYHLENNFEIEILPKLNKGEHLLYINYYGLKSRYIEYLHRNYGERLIVDNTQAFYDKPIENVDTFYSPRKFFGVPDGGYLYTTSYIERNLETGSSLGRFQHLLGRHEGRASQFYTEYLQSEKSLKDQPIKLMSPITSRILRSIDYEKTALIRKRNFEFLRANLETKLPDNFESEHFVPMTYPYFNEDQGLRKFLIQSDVYIPTYWRDAISRVSISELSLIENFIPLPIDQRVHCGDIDRLLSLIYSYYQ